jgi:hypothetical protein
MTNGGQIGAISNPIPLINFATLVSGEKILAEKPLTSVAA